MVGVSLNVYTILSMVSKGGSELTGGKYSDFKSARGFQGRVVCLVIWSLPTFFSGPWEFTTDVKDGLVFVHPASVKWTALTLS